MIDLLKKLWSIKDDMLCNPDYILSHGYGITKDKKLPESAKRVLDKTVELMDRFSLTRCIIVSSDYFVGPNYSKDSKESKEFEDELKREYLDTLGADFSRIYFIGGICSSLEEVARAIDFVLLGSEVVSVCDRLQARRIRLIWRKLTCHSQKEIYFKIVSIDGEWTRKMPSAWQQSEMRWLICNIVVYIATALLGNQVSKKTHKV